MIKNYELVIETSASPEADKQEQAMLAAVNETVRHQNLQAIGKAVAIIAFGPKAPPAPVTAPPAPAKV